MRTTIKALIWIYIVLLLLEGALRKWILPSIAEPLLVIRDPFVIATYVLAIYAGIFPMNKWVIATIALAVASVVVSLLGGLTNPIILLYGLRINYGHLPLIWIMAEVLDEKDVRNIGIFFTLSAIPMALIIAEQFRSPPNAWINKGIGADEGGQIFGAEGRIRPPGVFAFITGPQIYLPICTAFLLEWVTKPKNKMLPLLIASALAVMISTPLSISRTVLMANLIVVGVFIAATPLIGGSLGKYLKPAIFLGVIGLIASQLPIFQEGMRVFGVRWETAAVATDGDGWMDVAMRTLQTFTNPFEYAMQADLIGSGIGMGSNVASRLLYGQMGFLLMEEEYGKIFMELGLVVGTGFILFRVALTIHLGLESIRVLRHHKNVLPLLLFSAASVVVLFGQWAPPTIMGFAIVGSGVILASVRSSGVQNAVPAAPVEQAAIPEKGAPPPRQSTNRLAFNPKGNGRILRKDTQSPLKKDE